MCYYCWGALLFDTYGKKDWADILRSIEIEFQNTSNGIVGRVVGCILPIYVRWWRTVDFQCRPWFGLAPNYMIMMTMSPISGIRLWALTLNLQRSNGTWSSFHRFYGLRSLKYASVSWRSGWNYRIIMGCYGVRGSYKGRVTRRVVDIKLASPAHWMYRFRMWGPAQAEGRTRWFRNGHYEGTWQGACHTWGPLTITCHIRSLLIKFSNRLCNSNFSLGRYHVNPWGAVCQKGVILERIPKSSEVERTGKEKEQNWKKDGKWGTLI